MDRAISKVCACVCVCVTFGKLTLRIGKVVIRNSPSCVFATAPRFILSLACVLCGTVEVSRHLFDAQTFHNALRIWYIHNDGVSGFCMKR